MFRAYSTDYNSHAAAIAIMMVRFDTRSKLANPTLVLDTTSPLPWTMVASRGRISSVSPGEGRFRVTATGVYGKDAHFSVGFLASWQRFQDIYLGL